MKEGLKTLILAREGRLSRDDFMKKMKEYRNDVSNGMPTVKGGKYFKIINGDQEVTDASAIACLDYNTLWELDHQDESDRRTENLLVRNTPCIWVVYQSIARHIDREATGEKSDTTCPLLAVFDAYPVAFHNTEGTEQGYKKQINSTCKDVDITRNEFFLINTINIWFQIELYYMIHKKAIPLLVFSSHAAKHLFGRIDSTTTSRVAYFKDVPSVLADGDCQLSRSNSCLRDLKKSRILYADGIATFSRKILYQYCK